MNTSDQFIWIGAQSKRKGRPAYSVKRATGQFRDIAEAFRGGLPSLIAARLHQLERTLAYLAAAAGKKLSFSPPLLPGGVRAPRRPREGKKRRTPAA